MNENPTTAAKTTFRNMKPISIPEIHPDVVDNAALTEFEKEYS